MSNYNSVELMGRLTADPELKYTQSGVAYTRFTVAVNREQSKEQRDAGEKPRADFISCVAWRGIAEAIANYRRKGDLVFLEGRVETGSYEREGIKIYTTEVNVRRFPFMPKATNGTREEHTPTEPDVIPF